LEIMLLNMPVPDDMGRRGGAAATGADIDGAGASGGVATLVGRADMALRKSGLALGSGAENMGSSSSSLASALLERCMPTLDERCVNDAGCCRLPVQKRTTVSSRSTQPA
jgi:hypothetical protein